MSTLLSHAAPAPLKKAVWGCEPELLALWHGEMAPVWPGDRVRFYEPADGTLIFVDIAGEVSLTDGGDGDA